MKPIGYNHRFHAPMAFVNFLAALNIFIDS